MMGLTPNKLWESPGRNFFLFLLCIKGVALKCERASVLAMIVVLKFAIANDIISCLFHLLQFKKNHAIDILTLLALIQGASNSAMTRH